MGKIDELIESILEKVLALVDKKLEDPVFMDKLEKFVEKNVEVTIKKEKL
jgi:hypothetical protein